jgi:hypothetical protein
MPKSNYSDRRDANEPEIVKELERLGFYVIKMARTCGFDLLAIGENDTYIIEVKNPDTYWKLTDAELELQSELEKRNAHYRIVESLEDIEVFINHERSL